MNQTELNVCRSQSRDCIFDSHSWVLILCTICNFRVNSSNKNIETLWTRVVHGSILCDPIQPNLWVNPTHDNSALDLLLKVDLFTYCLLIQLITRTIVLT